ncbi:hypothetical protein MLDJOKPK_00288 [Salmonella phage SPAsTU]|nr:hypothetical protein MLDJOKPK_00288 [Salmonella phage SPAsTU]
MTSPTPASENKTEDSGFFKMLRAIFFRRVAP